MIRRTLSLLLMCTASVLCAAEPTLTSQLIFPLNSQHNHAPGIVQLKNGDLLVSWYRGSGNAVQMTLWFSVRA